MNQILEDATELNTVSLTGIDDAGNIQSCISYCWIGIRQMTIYG